MSLFLMLMIGGWTTAFAMFGLCALNECGKLRKVRRRIALWVDAPAPRIVVEREASLQLER